MTAPHANRFISMIYRYGQRIFARMLRQRGLHVAMYGGDGRRCLQFAKAYTQRQGLPAVTVSYPPQNEKIRAELERDGFAHDRSCRIVMERILEK